MEGEDEDACGRVCFDPRTASGTVSSEFMGEWTTAHHASLPLKREQNSPGKRAEAGGGGEPLGGGGGHGGAKGRFIAIPFQSRGRFRAFYLWPPGRGERARLLPRSQPAAPSEVVKGIVP